MLSKRVLHNSQSPFCRQLTLQVEASLLTREYSTDILVMALIVKILVVGVEVLYGLWHHLFLQHILLIISTRGYNNELFIEI